MRIPIRASSLWQTSRIRPSCGSTTRMFMTRRHGPFHADHRTRVRLAMPRFRVSADRYSGLHPKGRDMTDVHSSVHRPMLSVVAPCFNEGPCLPRFLDRMIAACQTSANGSHEIILVNDGSTDNTWPCIRAMALTRPGVVAVNLSRNHGHQLAVTAGLSQATGERVLVIDADLQDPPELLGE